MQPVECDYCGLPFKVRRVTPGEKHYCCAGCALADQVKQADGQFPVTPELVLALLAGFAVFNQVLGALMSWLMANEGRLVLAERFWWASLAAGGLTWLLTTASQLRSGAQRGIDLVILAASAGLLICGGLVGSTVCALAGSVAVLGWSARGWGRVRRPTRAASDLRK